MNLSKVAAVLGISTLFVFGCGKDATKPDLTVHQDTPQQVLESLQGCYNFQDLDGYSNLLADDFQFYLEPGRREELQLDPFWDRTSDLVGTERLFDGSDIADVRIHLIYDDPVPVNELGRENWVSITVLDTFVEVDLKPSRRGFEGLTLLVDGDRQVFYFRKGTSADDTDPASPTAEKYFLVEWRDFGRTYAPSPTPVQSVSWSTLKTLDI